MKKKLQKEKYPYQFHKGGVSTNDEKSTYRYPILWRYRNSVEQDFKRGYCVGGFGEIKLKIGVTKDGKHWVNIYSETQTSFTNQLVYCSEIEWIYPDDMKPIEQGAA